MRHARSAWLVAASFVLLTWAPATIGCSCVKFDANWWVEHAPEIFVAEITRIDLDHPLVVDWGNERNVRGINIAFRTIERIQGPSRAEGTLIQVGFEFACAPPFQVGHSIIILLSSPRQKHVGLCSTLPAQSDFLGPLKAAAEAKR
jgi:hypothetical protein